MVNANKLKRKIFDKVIKKLGSQLIITRYTKGAKDFNGNRTLTVDSTETIISVEADVLKNEFKVSNKIKLAESDLSLFIDPNIDINNTDTQKVKFTWFGEDYELLDEELVGMLQDIIIIKIIHLKRVQ